AGRETVEVSLEPRYVAQAELQRTPAAELLNDAVGYVYVPSFTLAGTGERVHALLADLKARGARSFVLDLRGNRGGSLAELGVLMGAFVDRSEEHTSELQSRENLVCRLLREKK